ncbi:MAG: hypothetical protein ACRCU3_02680 [Eubacteriaceae bacterium]
MHNQIIAYGCFMAFVFFFSISIFLFFYLEIKDALRSIFDSLTIKNNFKHNRSVKKKEEMNILEDYATALLEANETEILDFSEKETEILFCNEEITETLGELKHTRNKGGKID